MNPLFAQGLELMIVGMVVVFAFLVLLVWAVGLMSSLVARYAPEAAPAAIPRNQAAPATPAGTVDDRTLAVIRAAIREHRGKA